MRGRLEEGRRGEGKGERRREGRGRGEEGSGGEDGEGQMGWGMGGKGGGGGRGGSRGGGREGAGRGEEGEVQCRTTQLRSCERSWRKGLVPTGPTGSRPCPGERGAGALSLASDPASRQRRREQAEGPAEGPPVSDSGLPALSSWARSSDSGLSAASFLGSGAETSHELPAWKSREAATHCCWPGSQG